MSEINYTMGNVAFIEGENHLVIAAPHLHRLPGSKMPEFIQKLDTLKAMKIESNPLPPNIQYDCIEVMAKATMTGRPFEYIAIAKLDGTPLGEVIKEYNLPLEIVEVFMGFKPFLLKDMRPIEDAGKIAETVVSDMKHQKKERYPDLDMDRAIYNQAKVMKNLFFPGKMSMEEIINFCNAYCLFHGQILEYEVMQPDILDFRKRIDGKIGVLIGMLHAPGIDSALNGEPIGRPLQWHEYLNHLPPELLKPVELIEQEIFEEIETD